ncbi:hypothetical protein P692DRAFT_201808000 [Suillus brevipes Sb2]|nr:hypothetical protein P692DRAFT_201808000 [Suillus brevipes Sb2]
MQQSNSSFRSSLAPILLIALQLNLGTPSGDIFAALKQAAVIVLDRLSKDSAQPQRKDDWLRAAAIEDLPLQRAATRQSTTQQLESAARRNTESPRPGSHRKPPT